MDRIKLDQLDVYSFISEGEPLCSQIDPELFFPEPGVNVTPARKICAVCDLTEVCLTAAVEHGEEHGVWGGATPRQRSYLKTPAQVKQFVRWVKDRANTNKLMRD